jgi:hypothetical protein
MYKHIIDGQNYVTYNKKCIGVNGSHGKHFPFAIAFAPAQIPTQGKLDSNTIVSTFAKFSVRIVLNVSKEAELKLSY